MNSKKLGKKNKKLGHDTEIYFVEKFKKLGFKYCMTAKLGSQLHDNAKIDIINLPFNPQIKAGVQKSMNPGKELFNMHVMINTLFPPEDEIHSKPLILIHKRISETVNEEIVYMSYSQFLKYKDSNESLEYDSKRQFKFNLNSDFSTIVSMSFDNFVDNVLKINKYNDSSNT